MLKPMKLADVAAKTGIARMSVDEARRHANPGDPFLRNMACALSLHSWNNTAADWLRLQAALVLLRARKR